MAIRPILTLPDPLLRVKCTPVAGVDDRIRALMDDMLETMYDAPGIGLAASQIGVTERVIVVDVARRREAIAGRQQAQEDDEVGEERAAGEEQAPQTSGVEDTVPDPICLANPEIIWASEDFSVYEEGCLSIPEFQEEVERPAQIRVKYLDRDGKECEIHADGILATCLQHEIDHINGVLFIDHISRLKRERILKKFTKAARRENA
jgi:peptide deformylase